MRACAAFLSIMAGFAELGAPRPAAAAELPEAVVRVNRAPGAESCPPEAELVRSVVAASRVVPRERGPGKPVIDVNMERYGDAHFATIRVDGGTRGVRTLQADGAACDALRDAVILALLVLLEREAESPPSASLARGSAESAVPPGTGAPPKRRFSLHVSGGGALTFWEPLRLLPAVNGGAGVEVGPWEAGARVQWSPPRSIDSGPGSVAVQAWGVTARLCHAVVSREVWRVSGCGLGSLLALSGAGDGLDSAQRRVRPWWRAGLGLEGTLALTPHLGLTAFGSVFATLHEETFSVRGLGKQYGTSFLTGQVGAELRLRLF